MLNFNILFFLILGIGFILAGLASASNFIKEKHESEEY